MRDYRTMEQIAEDDVNEKSLRALVAANSSKDPSAVKRMYADVDNIRSRYNYSGFGTNNTIEATPDMRAEVEAQFPVDAPPKQKKQASLPKQESDAPPKQKKQASLPKQESDAAFSVEKGFNPSSYFDRANYEAATNAIDTTKYDQVRDTLQIKEFSVAKAARKKKIALQKSQETSAFKKQLGNQVAGLGTDSNMVKEVSEGVVSGTGSVLGGVGDLVEAAGATVGNDIEALGLGDAARAANDFLTDAGVTAPSKWFQSAEDVSKEMAATIDDSQDANFKQAMIDSTPMGDALDPSSWSMGEDASVEGFMGHLAGILGQFAPQAATLLAGSAAKVSAAMSLVGGLQAGGSQASEAEDYVMAMSPEELSAESDLYLDLLDKGLDHKEAQRQTAKASGAAAFLPGALIGSVGGMATAYILKPLQGILKGNVITRFGKTVVVSVTEEGTQEVSETVGARFGSNDAIGGDRDLTENTFADLVLGGSFGSSLAAPATIAKEIGDAGSAFKKRKDEVVKTQIDAFAAAVETNDITPYTDPESKNYDLAKAAGVLIVNNQQETTTPEQRTKNIAKVEELYRLAESDLKDKTAIAEGATDEAVARQKRQLSKQNELLVGESDTAKVAEIQGNIDMLTARISEAESAPGKKQKVVNEQLKKSQGVFDTLKQFRDSIIQTEEDVEVLKTTAGIVGDPKARDDVAPEDRAEAAGKLVTQSMASPDVLSIVDAQAMVEDTSNGLSGEQRQYLTSFADSMQKQNDAKSLNRTKNAIIKGEDGFRGIQDYRSLVNSALSSGDVEVAQAYAADLKAFSEGHTNKAKALSQAMKQFQSTGKPVQVVRGLTQGSWSISPDKLSGKEMADNQGLVVNAKSKNLVQAVRTEAKALIAASQEIDNLMGLAQPSTPKKQPEVASPTVGTTIDDEILETQTNEPSQKAAMQKTDPVTESAQAEPVESGTDPEATPDLLPPPAEGVPVIDNNQVAPAVEEAPVIESGRLDSIKGKEAQVKGGLATNKFRGTNLISAYFNQTAGKEGSVSLRPLAKIKNFLSMVIADSSFLSQFVKDDRGDLTERAAARDNMMAEFQETATGWNKALDSIFKAQTKVDIKYKNMVQFLVNEDGTLPENVKTAISYAAWTYVAENANDTWMNSPEQINAILGQPSSKPVDSKATTLLGDKGTRANVVINSLGERAVKALGLKALSDAPVNSQAQLESAMGAYTLALLMDQGLVERPVVTNVLLQRKGDTTNTGHPFVRLARDWESTKKNPVDAAKLIGEKVRNTQGYLDKVFGVEPGLKEPSFEPEDFTQEKTKGTSQDVPGNMAEIQDIQAKRAWKVRTHINSLWQSLDSDIREAIVNVEDPTLAHITQRLGIQGRNDSKIREIEQWDAFVKSVEDNGKDSLNPYDQAFYFMPNVWINQRAGLLSNTANPQSSKIQRHFMGMDKWQGEVSTARNNKFNKLFRANVALGLGIKAGAKPMAGKYGSLAELDRKIKSPLIQAALAAIKKQQADQSISRADQENIAGAVKLAGQEIQSLDALHALARMEVAIESGQKTFDPDMVMMEVDGKTNGPMLTLLLLGAANTTKGLFTLLNKGGFYEQGSDHKNFVTYKTEEGAEDLYETTTKTMNTKMGQAVLNSSNLAPIVAAVQFVKGNFLDSDTGKVTGAGRNLIKTPLTGMVFGQEVKNGIGSMFNEFIDDTYGKVSEIARSNATEVEKRADLKIWADHVNAMINDPELTVPANISLEAAIELEFSKEQTKKIRKSFDATVGEAVEATMDELFGVFLQRRKILNQGAQVSAQLYTMMREHLAEQKVESLIKQGQLASREGTSKKNKGKTQALQDLSPTQIAEIDEQLKALKPVAHSAMSQAEDNLDAGLFLPKESRKLSNDINYSQETTFGKPAPANTPDGNTISSMKTKGYKSVLEDPGVRTLILMIHSADSAISAYAYEQLAALNVHDANGLSIADVAKGARNLNEATHKVMLAFSVPLEIKATLERTVTGLSGFASMIEESPALQERFKELETDYVKRLDEIETAMFKASGLDWVSYVMQDVTEVAYAAEMTKLEAMGIMAFVDQYVQEGGEFEVTDALRQEALDKLEQVRAESKGPKAAEMQALSQGIATAVTGNSETSKLPAAPETRDVESFFEPQEIAATLKDWFSTKLNDLETLVRNTGTQNTTQREGVNRLKVIAETYPALKSIDATLEKVFPGNDQAKRRATWKSAILAQVQGRPVTTNSVLHAPNHAVLPLIDQLLASEDTSTELKEGLTTARDAMVAQQSTLAQAADRSLSGAMNAEVVEALASVYNGTRQTAYGELGTPAINSDTDMVAFMEGNPEMTAKDLMRYLDQRFKATNTNLDRTNRQLLVLLKQTVKGDMPVRYITRDTAETDLPQGGVSRAKGWYEPDVNNEHIGIKSPDFTHSGVSPELVLHELVHQALGSIVANEQAKPVSERGDAYELVNDLENLRKEAKKAIDSSEDVTLDLKYREAVSDLHEFIAWGMTNRDFQKDVLNTLVYDSTVKKGNKFITGMQKFIDKIAGLLFGARKDEAKTRGLSVLVANVTGLFGAAKEARTNATTGTQKTQKTQNQQSTDPFDVVKAYSSEQVYDALGRYQTEVLDPSYSEHLKEVLGGIVTQLHGPYGAYKAEAEQSATYGSEDVFLTSLMGKLPFASEIIGQPFKISQQEAFVLEQVEATVKASLNSSTAAYRELGKLYKETKARLKPQDMFDGDWSQATPSEQAEAEAQYRFIFTPKANADGTSDFLGRFAAMGLAYRPLQNKMMVATARDTDSLRGMKLGEQLKAIFKRLLNLINGRLTKTYAGQRADQKLSNLMDQLVSIESRRLTSLARHRNAVPSAIEGSLSKLSEGMKAKADKFGQSKFFRNSKNSFVEGTGVVVSMVAGDRVRATFDNLENVRNRNFKERQGLLSSIVTEFKGANETNLTAHELLRMGKKNDQDRKTIIDQTAKTVFESYAEAGETLTEADMEAITRVLLRTDMAALLDTYNQAELLDLVRDDKALDTAIAIHEKQIQASGPQRNYWSRGAKDLGYFMATNINRNDNLMKNAYNLARLFETDQAGKITETKAAEVEGILDKLASLYALKYSPSKDRGLLTEIMKTELQRGNESGIEMTLLMHKNMKEKSMESLFDNKPALFIKGYTKEIYNPHKEVVIAEGVDGENLVRSGARKGALVPNDSADTPSEKHIYTIEDGGLNTRVTGITSNTGSRRRGASVTRDQSGQLRKDTLKDIKQQKAAAIADQFKPDPNYDPRREAPQKMVPLMNNYGQAVNYQYMMNAETKDTLLERNNRMQDVMGSMAGSIVDKVNTKAHNETAIKALHEQYNEEGFSRPDAFIEISMNSTDPQIREIYRLLPDATKRDIRKVWGREAMMVRVDLVDLFFGYRKNSLSSVFDKNADERGAMGKIFVNILESPVFRMNKKAALRVSQAEDVWQELVKEIKDFLVIKNFFTLLGNATSNVSELVWMGVPITDIVKNHRIAFNGAISYQRDLHELMKLESMRDIGYNTQSITELDARIVELTDALARNPVKKLVDAGLFQTIVEDVDTVDDSYSYKSKLMRKVDSKTQWMPEAVKNTGKFFYMSHDTPLYKLMYQGTHLSDFVARYTLYEHMVSRKKNPLTEQEAIQLSVEAFVNYDIPTHRFIQYLNDMGILWFTKYYMRIQKVIMFLMRDNPGRTLAVGLFANFFAGFTTLVESGFWNKLDTNPLGGGAFEYLSAVDEGITTHLAQSLIN